MTINARDTFELSDGSQAVYYRLAALEEAGLCKLSDLPYTIRVLLESVLRNHDGFLVTDKDIHNIAKWSPTSEAVEIPFMPARVILQDFTGVPAVVDMAALRNAMVDLGGDPKKVNPAVQVDLVIDHSVQVDANGRDPNALKQNMEIEYERNQERYEFLKWGQNNLDKFRAVPPGRGIVHQVNLEWIAGVAHTNEIDGNTVYYPDSLVGTDSHTTMINGIGVLGWGVGGIEAEAVMLGQPIYMLTPEVIGFELTGKLREGVTATDMTLLVVEILREKGVVGKFVEFYGDGVKHLPLADRATIANMAPEYGATCGFFPVDDRTIEYMKLTGRDDAHVANVERFYKAQGLWAGDGAPVPKFTDSISLDLGNVQPALAGPKRPQDRVNLKDMQPHFKESLTAKLGLHGHGVSPDSLGKEVQVKGEEYTLSHGDVVIAAITSCTNTSNPSVMLAAGLVARNARKLGLNTQPWVKTSLAPGSRVVTAYYKAAGLMEDLSAIGFNVVGYGCTTCIGNSGPLDERIVEAVEGNALVVAAVLSGNRNFEGRVHPNVRANYLASPPLVVAYALAGSMRVDLATDPIGHDPDGKPVFLREIWPSNAEIARVVEGNVTREMFRARYSDVFKGPPEWQGIAVEGGETYRWNDASTYVRNPPYFEGITPTPAPIADIAGAKLLALLGDSITTDHISPAGSIKKTSPAGQYLLERQVRPEEFNSYGARRGNHEVMMRGTFANIRLRNEMVPGVEGGVTRHQPSGEVMTIYDAAMRYAAEGVPLVVVAGKEYGTGSSRDWAAKGTRLLGVRAVIAESFERIHRSNLVGMGVLPLVFREGTDRKTLRLAGDETFDVLGLADLRPRMELELVIHRADGRVDRVPVLCRVDTADEVEYFRHGGILPYVLRGMAKAA